MRFLFVIFCGGTTTSPYIALLHDVEAAGMVLNGIAMLLALPYVTPPPSSTFSFTSVCIFSIFAVAPTNIASVICPSGLKHISILESMCMNFSLIVSAAC